MLVLVGLVVLCGVSVAVGTRLLLLARRTRGFPERALGLFFLLGGGFGYPLSALGAVLPAWQGELSSASSVFTGVSQLMLFVFTARVFRGGDWKGRIGMAVGASLVLLYVLGYSIASLTATTDQEMLRAQMVWGGVSLVMSLAGYGWTGFESLRHYVQYRRRLAIGLADPVVTNRMLLWGLMGLTVVFVVLADAVLLYSASTVGREVGIPLVTCAGGVVAGGLLVLAFFPPRAYLDAIRGTRAAA